jgi:tetratricopeptide (TPR) repeat protein
MELFGVNEWALSLTALIAYALSIPMLLQLLRKLFDDRTAVLAVFLFIAFPITTYFYNLWDDFWILPISIVAWGLYIQIFSDIEVEMSKRARLTWLAISLFLLVQISWSGVFYAAAIGMHYLGRCLYRRLRPSTVLLSILIAAPLVSLIIDFALLIGGDGGDYKRLLDLFLGRTGTGVDPQRSWPKWLAMQWEYTQADFTLPVLILVAVYLVWLLVSRVLGRETRVTDSGHFNRIRAFPFAWIFLGPGVLNMLLLSNGYWGHQFQYVWFAPWAAIVAAIVVLQMRDWLGETHRLAKELTTLLILGSIVGFAAVGLNHFYASRHFPESTIAAFRKLNREIPPDGALLSSVNFVFKDPNKPSFYRPEVAWNLDRGIVTASTIQEVDELAGSFPFYLADVESVPPAMLEELKRRYSYEVVPGQKYHRWPPEISYFPDRYLFDLRITPQGKSTDTMRVRSNSYGGRIARYEEMYRKGNDMVGLKRYEDAIEAYREGVKLLGSERRVADSYNNIGWSLQQLKKYDEAIAAYEQAIALDPSSTRARNNLAGALLERHM